MRQRMTSQAGFSLIELMIAIVILAVGLLALAQLQVTAMQSTTHSAGTVGANALGQRIIEEIMSFPPDATLVTTAGGQPFLSTAVNAGLLIYQDPRRLPGRPALANYSNVIISDDGFFEDGTATGIPGSGQMAAGIYQVTYTTTPNYTGRAATDPQVCQIVITVRDLTETKFRNRTDFTMYKNWTP